MIGPSDRRLPALDGLRGIAILLVLQYHFWNMSFGLFGRPPQTLVDDWAVRAFGLGWSGVDLFFVLSGFLITGILYDAKSGSGYLRTFFGRRILRIVPVYYAFILFVLLIVPFFAGLSAVAEVDAFRETQFWYWTFLVNIASCVKPLDVTLPLVYGHLWSLAVEEQFYLVWPLVILAFGRRTMMGVCIALAVGAFGLRLALTAGFLSNFFAPNAAAVLMPARMDSLALGALVALAVRGGELQSLRRLAPFALAAGVAVLAGVFFRNDGLGVLHVDVTRFAYTAFAVLFAALLVFTLTAQPGAWLHRGLSHPALRLFGRYSYAMYIVHMLVGFALARQVVLHGWRWTPGDVQVPTNLAFSLTATLITLGSAWISWRVIEQPFLRLKSHFAYGAPQYAQRPDAPTVAVVPSQQAVVATQPASSAPGTPVSSAQRGT